MLRAALKYLDNTTEKVLKFFFKSTALDDIQLSKDPDEADFLVVDFDRKIDDDFWQQIEQNRQYAVVLCSDETVEIDSERTIKLLKPMKIDNFSQALLTISDLISKEAENPKQTQATTAESLTAQPAEHSPTTDAVDVIDEQPHQVDSDEVEPEAEEQELTVEQDAQVDDSEAVEDEPEKSLEAPPIVVENRDAVEKFTHRKHRDFDWDLFLEALHDEGEVQRDFSYPVNLRDPGQLRKLFFDPEKYLYHHLMLAVKMGESQQTEVSISTPFCSFFYRPQEQKFYRSFGEHHFRAVQSSPVFGNMEVTPVAYERRVGSHAVNAHKLIWESAIFASEGRLPTNTDPNQPMVLRDNPGVSRLTAFSQSIQHINNNNGTQKRKIEKDAISNAFKQANEIVKSLAKKRQSLIELEENHRDMPQRHLLTLYCAMQAIHSIDSGDSTDNESENKSFSSKILSRLFGR